MSFFKKKDFFEVKDSRSDLVLLGLGAIVGTGVFVLTGLVSANYSGPAVTLSYLIAGVTCIFVALVYTELATMLPTSGSIYTYSYVAFGELSAWLMASILIIELGFSSATVAAGWSAYVVGIIESAGISLPVYLTKVPSDGGFINLPALFITLFVGFVLYLGTRDSKRLNTILVFVKMMAIFVFIVIAAPNFNIKHWRDFMPFGFNNVLVGSSILFFSYTGFGSLASTAEECKNPKKDLTIGIIGSLVLATTIYIIVAGLLTGIVDYKLLNNAQPLALALRESNSNVGSAIVAVGAVAGMTTVIMMNLYALSRIFYVISRDGLLPKFMSKLHPKHDTPYFTLIIFVVMVSALGCFCPYEILGKLSSMAALIDYLMVSMSVVLFRLTLKDVDRPFKCPMVFVVAPVAFFSSLYLLFKQILDEEGKLLMSGKIIIMWIIFMAILYIVRSLFLKSRNKIILKA